MKTLTRYLFPGWMIGALALLASTAVLAEPVELTIRALANDAKLIGDGTGSAEITVTHVESGEVLSQGKTHGGTGDTGKIMLEGRKRDALLYATEGSAKFVARFDVEEPSLIEIAARGPLDYPQAEARASKLMWVFPGYTSSDEGIVLVLNGFIVELLTPQSESVRMSGPGNLMVKAKVRLLCGCPTQPGGLWNSNDYQMQALLLQHGSVIQSVPLTFSGTSSVFDAALPIPEAGEYQLEVRVADPMRGNFGRVAQPIRATSASN